MEFFRTTHIDFLGKRYICLALSAIIMAVSIWSLTGGVNRGIDFAGGTEIQVKFASAPPVADLRSHLGGLGIGDVSLQRIGAPEDEEFLVRVGSSQRPDAEPAQGSEAEESGASEQERVYDAVLGALRELTDADASAQAGKLDLNVAGAPEIAALLAGSEAGAMDARALAQAIVDYRTTHAGLFHAFSDLEQVEELTPEVREFLESSTRLGPLTVRRVEYVGPRVGRELAEKAYLAMFFALAGMLVYITVRFRNLSFALGGILALVHDGTIAAGIFNLWGGQFDLTIVAAILTLLGYSINDTIVIFDRVRENMRAMRGTELVKVFNDSINQTLSRTFLTSFTTLLVVVCLYAFGGEAIRGFAFMLMVGLVVGTYSTVFIASPVVIAYESWVRGRRSEAKAAGGSPDRNPRRRSAAGR